MVRSLAVAAALSCLVSFACAQSEPIPPTSPAAAAAKPAAKKPAAKSNGAAKQAAAPVDSGRCQLGVIPALGDQFVVQKVGLTMFGNDRKEVPIGDWGLNELVVARVRAAAGSGISVRRFAYPKDVFERHVEPGGLLFRNARTELNESVRQVAAGATCERYVLVTRSTNQFATTNQTVNGVGIVDHDAGFLRHTYLFAAIYIRVFDGRSFDVIKQAAPAAGKSSYREVDNSMNPSPPAEAAKNPVLRDGVRAFLTSGLDATLPALLGP
jgi:hypothetical protein